MGMQESGSSLSGLAKRWLKNQLQVHGDPRRAAREREESAAIEEEIRERAQEEAGERVVRGLFDTFAPAGLKERAAQFQRMQAEGKAAEAARRRAEHEAKPRAEVVLRLRGSVAGELRAALPATVDRPVEMGDPLLVALEPLTAETIGGRPFQALSFALPGYHGPGTYDLERMGRGEGAADWDPLWFTLALDEESEPFYWAADTGMPASAVIDETGNRIELRMRMTNAASEEIEVALDMVMP